MQKTFKKITRNRVFETFVFYESCDSLGEVSPHLIVKKYFSENDIQASYIAVAKAYSAAVENGELSIHLRSVRTHEVEFEDIK